MTDLQLTVDSKAPITRYWVWCGSPTSVLRPPRTQCSLVWPYMHSSFKNPARMLLRMWKWLDVNFHWAYSSCNFHSIEVFENLKLTSNLLYVLLHFLPPIPPPSVHSHFSQRFKYNWWKIKVVQIQNFSSLSTWSHDRWKARNCSTWTAHWTRYDIVVLPGPLSIANFRGVGVYRSPFTYHKVSGGKFEKSRCWRIRKKKSQLDKWALLIRRWIN